MDTENQHQVIDKNDPTRLGRERIGKLMVEFAIPAIIAMTFNTLYNIIDTAFLQQSLGDSGAAVATLAWPVMTLLMGFSMLAGQGGNALAAILMGEGKHDRVEKTLGNTVFLLVALAVLVALAAVFFMDFILDVVSTPDSLRDWTSSFLMIICCGFVFQSVGMGVNNFLRTAGKPTFAMLTQGFGTLMCIVFNYLFVMYWGWGVVGSASATILGQTCGMIPTVWFFIGSKKAAFKLRLRYLAPEARLCGRILVMGVASFITQVGNMVVSLVFNMVVAQYAAIDGVAADTALAALGIAMKAASFAFTPMIGMIMAVQPIIGFNFGAKLWGRVLKTFKWAVIVCMIIGFTFTICAFVIPGPIVSIFGVKDEGFVIASHAITITALLYGPVGFQVMGGSYFQSSGQPLKSALLEMTRQIIILVPLYLFMPPIFMQVLGLSGLLSIVACQPLSDFLSICVTTCFVVHEVRKVRRWKKEAIAAGQPVDVLPDDALGFDASRSSGETAHAE